MKDFGLLSYFLGLEVTHSSNGTYLSKAKYAYKLISKVVLIDNKITSPPLEPNVRLAPTDGTLLSDACRCKQLVGSLIYLTVTRPNISHVVHVVS